MRPSEVLRSDHAILRSQLTALERQLTNPDATSFALSRLMDALAERLRCHTEYEERLWDAHCCAPEFLESLHDDHENQRTRLAVLHTLLADVGPISEAQVLAQAAGFIHDLRRHMALEEAVFFSDLEMGFVGHAGVAVKGPEACPIGRTPG